jgi:hypothetical protein
MSSGTADRVLDEVLGALLLQIRCLSSAALRLFTYAA